MMAGVAELIGRGSCGSDRRRNAQLYRGLSGRTGCMVTGGGTVDRNVFLHYECTFEKYLGRTGKTDEVFPFLHINVVIKNYITKKIKTIKR